MKRISICLKLVNVLQFMFQFLCALLCMSENYSTKPSQSAPDAPNDSDKAELGSTLSVRRSKQVFLAGCRF